MRGFRRREQERQTQIRSKLLQLSTEIRRGRTGQRRARVLLQELQALCGTNDGITAARILITVPAAYIPADGEIRQLTH